MTTATRPIPTIAVFPEEQLTLDQKIEKWVYFYMRALEDNYTSRYPDSSSPVTFRLEVGRKYLKVVQNDGGVHAFVDRKTGEVYKPASWKSPAKHVRFDLRIINDRELLHNPKFTDWAGGYLYMR
jgi:hypothetical protein